MMKMRVVNLLIVCVLLAASNGYGSTLLWHLSFDGDMSETVSGEHPFRVTPNPDAAAPYNKQAPGIAKGLGVNGGDALDMRPSMPVMGGGTNPGGWVQYGTTDPGGYVDDALNGLQSFTIMGWINTGDPDITTANGARVFLRDDNANGLAMIVAQHGRVSVAVNNNWYTMPYPTEDYAFECTNRWVFFAMTYDSAAATENLKLYSGQQDTADVVLEAAVDMAVGVLASNNRPFVIGNNGGTNTSAVRGFKGLIDQMRLFGSTADGTGVLTAAEITAYKNADWQTPPAVSDEPDPLWYLPFDDVNMSEAISGTLPRRLYANPAAPEPYNTQPPVVAMGQGVRPGGGALDMSVSMPTMGYIPGEPREGGAVIYGSNAVTDEFVDDAFDALKSFTLMGWLKADVPLSGMSSGARFLVREDNVNGFSMFLNNDGRMQTAVNGTWLNMPWDNFQNNTFPHNCYQEWVFFAVTYDGTATQDNFRYYSGRRNDGYVLQDTVLSAGTGTLNTTGRQLVVGNNGSESTSAVQGFKGLIDELRLFGSYNDGSGVMTMADIQQYKQIAFTPVCDGVLIGDLNGDCVVDITDFKMMAENWLEDNRPLE